MMSIPRSKLMRIPRFSSCFESATTSAMFRARVAINEITVEVDEVIVADRTKSKNPKKRGTIASAHMYTLDGWADEGLVCCFPHLVQKTADSMFSVPH